LVTIRQARAEAVVVQGTFSTKQVADLDAATSAVGQRTKPLAR
jgi:hypothetical protein